jgi:hypothetical protein
MGQVAHLHALKGRSKFLGHHLEDIEGTDRERRELELTEVPLRLEVPRSCGERGPLAEADLQSEVPAGVPGMTVRNVPDFTPNA